MGEKKSSIIIIFFVVVFTVIQKKAQRGDIFLSTILSKSSSICNNDNNYNNLKSAFAHTIVIQFLCLNVSYQNCNENEISIERGEKKWKDSSLLHKIIIPEK